MDNKDNADPLAVAQARVDNLTSLLERLMDDENATIATTQLGRERLTGVITLLDALLKSKARANPSFSVTFQHSTSGIPRQASAGEDPANGGFDIWRAI